MLTDIELNYLAIRLRRKLGSDEYSPIDIFSLVNNYPKLTIIKYPFQDNISGVCIKDLNTNVIAVNSNMSLGRQRFSLAHELYHLEYGTNDTITISSVDLYNNSEVEDSANKFASYFLMPYNILRDELEEIETLDINSLIKLETKYGISNKALVYRLSLDTLIDERQKTKFSDIDNLISKTKKLGLSTEVYEKTNDKKTFGYYIKQVEMLKEKDLISLGKQNELLLTAFRNDLVYKENKEVVDV